MIGRIYRGRVQGVGFRFTCQTLARGLNISGSVRNEPDGSVRVIAVASDDLLDRLDRALHERFAIERVEPFAPPTETSIPEPFEILL